MNEVVGKRSCDFGPFTESVYSCEMTVNDARERMNKLACPNPEYKPRPVILVIAKNAEQAQLLWRHRLRDRYPEDARVKFISRNQSAMDGLRSEGMTIIYAGEWRLNPSADCSAIEWYKKLGAKVVYEDV